MSKEFIPYEQASELKELGFDEPCFGYYTGDKKHLLIRPNMGRRNEDLNDIVCTAPLYQQAFRWFREKCNIFSSVDVNYCYKIYVNDEFFEESINYNSHEEAEFECLKKLIEIIKEQK